MEIGPLVKGPLVSVGPDHSVAEAARRMSERNVGSAVVVSEEGEPAIITERDLMRAVAAGVDLNSAVVGDYMTSNAITASPSWDVDHAASIMVERGFRHLVIVGGGGEVTGVLSIRDLVGPLLERT